MNDFEKQEVAKVPPLKDQEIFKLGRYPDIITIAICAMSLRFYYQAIWLKNHEGLNKYKLISSSNLCGVYEYIKYFGDSNDT